MRMPVSYRLGSRARQLQISHGGGLLAGSVSQVTWCTDDAHSQPILGKIGLFWPHCPVD